MKTKKVLTVIFTIAVTINSFSVRAQVKVGSNPTTISSTSNLEVEATNGVKTVIEKSNGNVGIGSVTPTNGLHVKAAANPVRFEGIQSGSGANLVIDPSGIVKSENIATAKLILVLRRNTAWTATTNHVIPWDGEEYDPENAFTPGASSYIIKKTGLHQIFLNASVSGPASFTVGSSWYLRILKNGGTIAASDAVRSAGASSTVFSVEQFNAGDVISVDFGGSTADSVNPGITKLSVFRID